MTGIDNPPAVPEVPTTPVRKIELRWYKDWTTISSAVVLLVTLPISVFCLYPYVWALSLVLGIFLPFQIAPWMLIAAYFAFIPLLVLPRMEWLQVLSLGKYSRRPTIAENAKLQRVWDKVHAQAQLTHKRRWVLRVVESDEINTAAVGGSMVLVTTFALRDLPDDELAGILAHEVGHHVGFHPITLIVEIWMMRPIQLMNWSAIWLHNLAAAIMSIGSLHWILFVLLFAVQLVLRLLAFILKWVVVFASAILQAFGRRAEYQADKVAVELGFGVGLYRALSRFHEEEKQLPLHSQSLAINSHPPTYERLNRIRTAHIRAK